MAEFDESMAKLEDPDDELIDGDEEFAADIDDAER